MISAELSYRDFVGQWTIAVEFAKLQFSGDKNITYLLERLSHLIEFEKYDKQKAKIKCLEEVKEQNNSKIEILEFEINSLKKKYKIIALHKEEYNKIKYYRKEIERLSLLNQNIDFKIAKLDDDLFLKVHELKSKYKSILACLGFSCKASYNKKENSISIEIYEYNGDEKLLAQKVRSAISEIQEKIDAQIAQIKRKTNEKLNSTDITPSEILQL